MEVPHAAAGGVRAPGGRGGEQAGDKEEEGELGYCRGVGLGSEREDERE